MTDPSGNINQISYQTMVEATGTSMLVVEADTTILMVNDEFERLSGYSKEEMEGNMSWVTFVHEGDKERLLRYNNTRRISDETAPRSYEFLFKTREGITRNLIAKVTLMKDLDLSIVSLMDVTELKEFKRKIAEDQQLISNVFKDSMEGIYVTDLDGKILKMNRSALKMFQFTDEEILNINARDTYSNSSDRSRFKEIIHDQGFVKDFEVLLKRKDGSTFDSVLTSSIRKDHDGNVVGYNGMIRDVSELKRDERRIQELNRRLKDITQILRHDMLNNLMIIKQTLELIELTGDVKRLSMVEASVNRSVTLIDEMKEYEEAVTVDDGTKRKLVKNLIQGIMTGFNIPYDIVGEADFTVDVGFYTVIQNLVINAIKHGHTGRMRFVLLQDAGENIVDVIDFGNGIPMGIREKIFEEGFSYGDKGGTGVGLFLVSSMVKRSKGEISLMEHSSRGATFRIRLPMNCD